MTTINQITRQMNALELVIAREQNHISKFGNANDKDSDSAWETYKTQSVQNLKMWDELKVKRNKLKMTEA